MNKIIDEKSYPPIQRKTSNFVFWNKTRVYIMVISLTCLTLSQMNSLTFNFSVICMDDVVKDHYSTNQTELHWMERTTERSILFSGAAIGGIIGLFPAVPLITKLGLRNVLTISGFISAAGSFFFPPAVAISFYAVLFCRILQGIGSSVLFTVMGMIPGVWAPDSEAGTYLAILSCALQFSNIVCMPVSGILCESSLGWRSIYYIFGVITFAAYIIFYFTYKDSPKIHRNVSEKELGKIASGRIEQQEKGKSIPYKAICSDICVIVTWISCFGGNLGFFMLSLYGPTYLREILNFDIRETGFISALPFILSAILKFFAGQLSDKLHFVSEKTRFVLFAVVSQLGLVAGLLVMAATTNRLIAQIAFTFSIVASGLNIMGVIKSAQLRCRQHVHFTVSVISFTAYAVQFVAPIAVAIICPDNTPEQWCLLFIVASIVITLFNAPFPFFSSSEPAEYTKSKLQLPN